MTTEGVFGPARALLVFAAGVGGTASSADAARPSLGAGQAAGLASLLSGCVLRPALRRPREDEDGATGADEDDIVVVGNKGGAVLEDGDHRIIWCVRRSEVVGIGWAWVTPPC